MVWTQRYLKWHFTLAYCGLRGGKEGHLWVYAMENVCVCVVVVVGGCLQEGGEVTRKHLWLINLQVTSLVTNLIYLT